MNSPGIESGHVAVVDHSLYFPDISHKKQRAHPGLSDVMKGLQQVGQSLGVFEKPDGANHTAVQLW